MTALKAKPGEAQRGPGRASTSSGPWTRRDRDDVRLAARFSS
jgi:hypothetical protein